MIKRILPAFLLLCSFAMLFSCKKSSNNTSDATRNYFPLQFGKYVTYSVDSTYYIDSTCSTVVVSSQQRYAITDTFRDTSNRLSYLLDIFSRPNANSDWKAQSVVYVTPTINSIEYVQNQLRFIKLTFVIEEGKQWLGNYLQVTSDSMNASFYKWVYTYQNFKQPFNNGYINFGNTVTVLEEDSTGTTPANDIDSFTTTNRTYYKEIYGYGVGLIYREFTHFDYHADSESCKNGYSVIMRAIDHN